MMLSNPTEEWGKGMDTNSGEDEILLKKKTP